MGRAASDRVNVVGKVDTGGLEGRTSISVVQFEVQPEPDYRDCEPEELPY
jgi:hypothetical protein